jgi:hypothetical protein
MTQQVQITNCFEKKKRPTFSSRPSPCESMERETVYRLGTFIVMFMHLLFMDLAFHRIDLHIIIIDCESQNTNRFREKEKASFCASWPFQSYCRSVLAVKVLTIPYGCVVGPFSRDGHSYMIRFGLSLTGVSFSEFALSLTGMDWFVNGSKNLSLRQINFVIE